MTQQDLTKRVSGTGVGGDQRQRTGPQGFTLLELMLVVAIIGISAAMVVPNIAGTISQTRANGAVAGISATLARARVTAMKRHLYIEVNTDNANAIVLYSCPARYGRPGCISSYSDETDLVQQGVVRVGTGDTVGVTLTPPGNELVFTPQGFPQTAVSYEYTISSSASATVRKVMVSAAGEISVQ